MKKKLILVFLFSTIPLAVFAANFADVSENHPNYEAIRYVSEKGIVQGYENEDDPLDDALFKPDKFVNRAEALKIILMAFGNDQKNPNKALIDFPDVDQEAWYAVYIKKALQKRIISGYPDGKFRPEAEINLAEALKMILLLINVDIDSITLDENPYADVDKKFWFAPYTLYAKSRNLIWPQRNGLLKADRALTRSEITEIIYRLLYIRENNLEYFDLSTNWPLIEKKLFYFKIKHPAHWKIIDNKDSLIFWRKDDNNKQMDFIRTYDSSLNVIARLLHNVEENYIENLKNYYADYQFEEVEISGLNAIKIMGAEGNKNIYDLYLSLNNGQVLVFYGTYGNGLLKDWFFKQIQSMYDSFEFIPDGGIDTESILSEANKQISVDGKGQEVLDMFHDKILIDTDEIGVGTGPVDYYYSASSDVTLKYERSFDVILGIEKGKGSDF